MVGPDSAWEVATQGRELGEGGFMEDHWVAVIHGPLPSTTVVP